MVTEGVIQYVDYERGIYHVRLPLFESCGNQTKIIVNAVVLEVPGMHNCYQIDDLVWVTFENDAYTQAVICGKIGNKNLARANSFLCKELNTTNIINEDSIRSTSISSQILSVSNQATLPINTTFSGIDNDSETDFDLTDINSLRKLLETVKILVKKVNDLTK